MFIARLLLLNRSNNNDLRINHRWIRDTSESKDVSHCPVCRGKAQMDDICDKNVPPVSASGSIDKHKLDIRINELEHQISELLVLD